VSPATSPASWKDIKRQTITATRRRTGERSGLGVYLGLASTVDWFLFMTIIKVN